MDKSLDIQIGDFIETFFSLNKVGRALMVEAMRYIVNEAKGQKQDHICAVCFEPIKKGCGLQIREGGRYFHTGCIEAGAPLDYFIKQEKALSSTLAKV